MTASKVIIRVAACSGVALSLILFGTGGWYLYEFMDATNESIEQLLAPETGDGQPAIPSDSVLLARFAMARIAFNSCGLVVALAIAFLAVALFLLGVEGSMDVQAQRETLQVSITRMSAGAFSILCATAIVITCLMVKPTLKFGGDPRVETVDPAVVAPP